MAPGVPRPQQGAHQRLLVHLLAGQEGDGALPQRFRRDGGLHRRPGGGHRNGPGVGRQATEDGKAQLLVLPADPLHLPQGQLPLRVVPGQGLPQKEVQLLAKADGGLLVLGNYQPSPAQLPAEGRQELGLVNLRPSGKQHRPPPLPDGGLDLFVLLPGGDKLFHHVG